MSWPLVSKHMPLWVFDNVSTFKTLTINYALDDMYTGHNVLFPHAETCSFWISVNVYKSYASAYVCLHFT